jgi:hypothetical protein
MVYATTNANFQCSNDGWVTAQQNAVESVLIPLAGVNYIITLSLNAANAKDLSIGYLYFYDYLVSVFNFLAYFGSGVYYFLIDDYAEYAQYWCDASGWLDNATQLVYPYVEQLKSLIISG